MKIFNISFLIIIFPIFLEAKSIVYRPDDAKNLILTNSFDHSIERIIYINDLILIDIKQSPINYAGKFISIQGKFLFIEKKSILGSSIISIDINKINKIYFGIGRTFRELRNRWGLGFAIAVIPGSIQMAYQGEEHPIIPRPVGAFITWALFGTMGYTIYGNIFGGIDYLVRKGKAQEFIIGSNDWIIN